jgi:hypothetical protein
MVMVQTWQYCDWPLSRSKLCQLLRYWEMIDGNRWYDVWCLIFLFVAFFKYQTTTYSFLVGPKPLWLKKNLELPFQSLMDVWGLLCLFLWMPVKALIGKTRVLWSLYLQCWEINLMKKWWCRRISYQVYPDIDRSSC